MGKPVGQLDHEVEARQSAVEEIVRQYPGATVAWDLKLDPYMIVVSVNGSIVRAFVERRTLIERGATYEAFMRKLSEQVIDSQRVIELLGRDEGKAPAARQRKPLGPA